MMMPPKKSKAARKGKPRDSEEESNKDVSASLDSSEEHAAVEEKEGNEEEAEESKQEEPKEKKTQKKKPHFNVFDVTTVDGKRKRQIPMSEQVLNDWINIHCVTRDDTCLSIPEVHSCYLEMCVASSSVGVDQTVFSKNLRAHFPKGFGFKEESPYFGQVKEKKIQKKVPKVKADTLNLKMRDIIERSLEEFGNPKTGIRFNKILTYIAGKYPALRIELRPKMLLNGLQRGVRFGYLTCDRGIGRCGFYRKYVDDEDEDEEDAEKESKGAESKGKGEESVKGEDGEKQKDGEDGKDVVEDGAGAGTKADKAEPSKKKKKVIPGKKKKSAPKKRFIQHSNPKRLEDTFYLGMTFMSEPKEASVGRIKKYIQENYRDVNVETRLKKCLETGKERGYWEQITGSGSGAGTFRLLVDEFDPSDDDDLIGMVVNAIMAGTEPKMCSAVLLKKYVMEWFADKFKLVERPNLFKKALERAVANNEIRQLSGIGASGTFQLAKPFFPSPLILAGQDTESDYESSDSSEEEEERTIPYDFANYGDAYKPRPSKRRGMARIKAVHAKPAVEMTEVSAKKRGKRSSQRKRKRNYKDESSSEESSEESSSEESSSEEEQEEPPPKSRSRTPAKSGRGQAKAPAKKSTPAKRKPSPAKKPTPQKRDRSQSSQRDKRSSSAKTPKMSIKKEPETPSRRNRSQPDYMEDSSSEEEYHHTPSRSRSAGGSKKKASSSHGRKARMSSDDDTEDEIQSSKPRTPAAKKQGTAKTPSQSRGRKVAPDSESDDTEPEKYTPKPAKSRGRRKVSESNDDDSEEEERTPPKSRRLGSHSRGKKSRRGIREASDSSEDDSDRDEVPSKPAKLQTPKTPAAKKQGSSPAPTKSRHRKK